MPLDLIGGLAGSALTSALNVHETRQNRRFQRDMSNTAVQRHRKDLEAAGFNPLLAVEHGAGGASTPSGSVGHVDSPRFDMSSALQIAELPSRMAVQAAQASDATAAAQLKNEQKFDLIFNRRAQRELLAAHVRKMQADGDLTEAHAKEVLQSLGFDIAGEEAGMKTRLGTSELHQMHSALDLAKAGVESEFYESLGQSAKWLQMGTPLLNSVLGRFMSKIPGFGFGKGKKGNKALSKPPKGNKARTGSKAYRGETMIDPADAGYNN